jgi:uncharacterized protein
MAEPVGLMLYQCASPRAVIVLAHGAGAGQQSPFMVALGRGFGRRGVAAATFDFPYMTARRRVPDRAPVLEAAWRQAIAAGRTTFGPLPLFLGGKSMGGRIASQVAAGGDTGPLAGLVFFGYPLHPPAKPGQRRDAHLPQIAAPVLFVQGERDAFGAAEEIRALLPSLARATLHVIAGGDHSLKAPGRAQPHALEEALDAACGWIHGIAGA